MDGTTDINLAKKLFGSNFIGPDEISSINSKVNISVDFFKKNIPPINFSMKLLERLKQDYILILGVPVDNKSKPLSLNNMRQFFGIDPSISEPCFYNQDWYLKENFAQKTTLEFKWYLIRKTVVESTRGKRPDEIEKMLSQQENYPLAVLTAYTFFLNYFINGGILWKHDFIWCSDHDHNGDRIYTGRYIDQTGINKNGFNIHRHLSIRPFYGLAPQIV